MGNIPQLPMFRVCTLGTIVKIKEYSVKAVLSNKMQKLYEISRLSFTRYNCSFKKRTSELMHGCQPIPGATQGQGGGYLSIWIHCIGFGAVVF